jgi:hypothetical protein
VCVTIVDIFVSVSLPFTTTGFKYVSGKSFSVLLIALSTCLKALVLPLPSKSKSKKKSKKITYKIRKKLCKIINFKIS